MTRLTPAMTAPGSASRRAITVPTTICCSPSTSASPRRHRGRDARAGHLGQRRILVESLREVGGASRPGGRQRRRDRRRDVGGRGAGRVELFDRGLDQELVGLSAQRRHLRDARDGGEGGAQHLVLELAQRPQRAAAAHLLRLQHRHRLRLRRDERVLKYPPGRGRRRADLDPRGRRQARSEGADATGDLGAAVRPAPIRSRTRRRRRPCRTSTSRAPRSSRGRRPGRPS